MNDVYTRDDFEFFTFPDGQPHVKMKSEKEHSTLMVPIRSGQEYVETLLMLDVLSEYQSVIQLVITYQLGARMDRRIDHKQPNTARTLMRSLRHAAQVVCVVEPHSTAALCGATPIHTGAELAKRAIADMATEPEDTLIILPDAGARDRYGKQIEALGYAVGSCVKKRDPNTGALSGFALDNSTPKRMIRGAHCLILDDLCDGGGTFAGVAAVLREVGVQSVNLAVTHGIFSKGYNIDGIDRIYTTNTYKDHGIPHNKFKTYDIAGMICDESGSYRVK